ncbi:hypothetical protein X975_15213, partial [Stegodyphus mimosarum]
MDILRCCCLKFRAQFLDVAGVDLFQYMTIVSACMATHRSGHIPADTIAMVPVYGYINSTNYSPDSIRWLNSVADSEGLQIQHALNGSGEHKIAEISVDGFCQLTQTVYQFQGCFFHGCSSCYDGDIIHPFKGVSMATLREKTEEIAGKLRAQGLTVIEMWEHEFQRQKEENPDLQAFLNDHHLRDRLNPRESFFGGRTNALKFFHDGEVNKYCDYPIGHPEIIKKATDVENYFGLTQCRVIPPFYLPIYEVYHFPPSSSSLFRSYIDLFLKIKQESSRWPANCVTSEDRLEYIRQYEEREGIKLDAAKVSKNLGSRKVAKLVLNSFWGRWGMNINKAQLNYVHTVPDLNKMLADPTKKEARRTVPTRRQLGKPAAKLEEFP